jgi:hypothetical protein
MPQDGSVALFVCLFQVTCGFILLYRLVMSLFSLCMSVGPPFRILNIMIDVHDISYERYAT